MKKMHLIMFAAVLLLITACAEQDSNDDLYSGNGGNADTPAYSAGHYLLDNSSIFNGGSPATGGRLNASITNVNQTEYDRIKDNNTLLQYDYEDYGNRNFNLLYRWKASIVYSNDKTKMYDPVGSAASNGGNRVGRLPVNGAYIPKPNELVRQDTIPVPTMPGVSFPHETHRHVLAGINFMGKDGKHFVPIANCGVCHTSGFDFHNYETNAAVFMQDNLTKDNKKIQGATVETNPAHAFCWNSCHTKIAEPTAAPKTTDCNTCHRIQSSGDVNVQYLKHKVT